MTNRDGRIRTVTNQVARSTLDRGHPPVDELVALHEGRCAEVAAEELREHLAVCPECSGLMLELDAFPGSPPDGEESRIEVPTSSLWAALERRLGDTALPGTPVPLPPRRQSKVVGPVPWLLRTAAAALLVLSFGLFFSLRENRRLLEVAAGQRLELEALAARAAPQADLPFVTLTPRSFVRDQRTTPVLELASDAAFFALHLTLAGHESYPGYRLDAIVPGETRWSLPGLVPREQGFSLLLPRRELGPGSWRLELFGLAEGGDELLEVFDVEIRQP